MKRLVLLVCVFLAAPAIAEEITLVAWNMESGGADPSVLGDQMKTVPGVDIWVLSEVNGFPWAREFDLSAEEGQGGDWGYWLSESGGGDRLQILYRKDRFKMLDHFEIEETNPWDNVRATLVLELESLSTGESFYVMANHLYRTNSSRRHQQATVLNQWIASNPGKPVINAGDFNFDWDVRNGDQDHDQGYDNLVANDRFNWVRPTALLKTQCSYDSVLDFVFVANGAKSWNATSTILFTDPSYCPDTNQGSDHRPVLAQFETGAAGAPVDPTEAWRATILDQIDRLEQQLQTLRDLVAAGPPN